jgi:hypothetical protein
MRDIFPEYYQPTPADFKKLWKEATFVVDANVLLNLYRYAAGTRTALINTLETIKDRMWIPHQVGLEYQRNRLAEIADQVKKFSAVRNMAARVRSAAEEEIGKIQLENRHPLLSSDKLLKSIQGAVKEFEDELKKLEKQQSGVFGTDEIRKDIDALLSARVGKAYSSDELDKIHQEGKIRYAKKIPPGYKDLDTKPDDRKYGDLILWKQIIKHANDNALKNLVFVTAERKEDWWLMIDDGEKQRIGPRPELTAELKRSTSIERFFMYSLEEFLTNANEHLKANVNETSIEEVRDIANQPPLLTTSFTLEGASRAIQKWFQRLFPDEKVIVNQELSNLLHIAIGRTKISAKIAFVDVNKIFNVDAFIKKYAPPADQTIPHSMTIFLVRNVEKAHHLLESLMEHEVPYHYYVGCRTSWNGPETYKFVGSTPISSTNRRFE